VKTLPVPYFKQDTNFTCGPTSMQMVLAYYGVRDSEARLAELLQTTNEKGTYRVKMYETAVSLGFHCYVNNEASFSEIKFLLDLQVPPIVRFLEPEANDDHYGVVVGATDDSLKIHDPWNGPEQIYKRQDFLKRWTCDTIGNCEQWLMAVSKESFPLGRQYHPHG
jgi:ABC-type bacteriocin/lantibiotic exporter with double-glycine peptidase domain